SGGHGNERVEGADVVEHALHGVAGEPGEEQADGDTEGEEFGAEAEELTQDLPGQGAEGHTDADLAASLADGVGKYAVGADRGEDQGHAGKHAGEDGRG